MESHQGSFHVMKMIQHDARDTVTNYFFKFHRLESSDLRHKTQLMTKWGTNSHFEVGVDALVELNSVSKSAEVSLDLKSSFDRIEKFKITAKGELMPRILENSFKIQVSFLNIYSFELRVLNQYPHDFTVGKARRN